MILMKLMMLAHVAKLMSHDKTHDKTLMKLAHVATRITQGDMSPDKTHDKTLMKLAHVATHDKTHVATKLRYWVSR